jgi:hypothetical protein
VAQARVCKTLDAGSIPAAASMILPRGRIAAMVAVVGASSVIVGALAPAAAAPPKNVPACKMLFPDDLEPIFGQPWVKGTTQLGGACEWQKPSSADVPDIRVTLLVTRRSTTPQAKTAFNKSADVANELADGIQRVRDLGDEAYAATLIGSDIVTVRVGDAIADVRVMRNDESEKMYPLQAVQVAQIVAARLAPPPRTAHKARTGHQG